MFPAVVSAVAAGVGRHLKRLQLGKLGMRIMPYSVDLTREEVATLAGLFVAQLDRFPALEEIAVGFDVFWADVLAGLARGGAPRLQKLFFLSGMSHLLWSSKYAMELLAVLEARAAKGCVGLAQLDLSIGKNWIHAGMTDVQRRLWSVLLPTLQVLPETDERKEVHGPITELLLEQGAPCLRRLEFWNTPLARALAQFKQLAELHLKSISMEAVAALEEAIAEAGGAQRFLPALQKLEVTITGAEREKAFFAAVARAAAFPQLRELRLLGDYGPQPWVIEGLGAAMAAGAFARLERLYFCRILDDEGLAAMVQGLAASPCARTLQSLELGHQDFEGGVGLRALGGAIGASTFPALTELRLNDNKLGDKGVVELMTHLKRGPPLALLHLRSVNCGDMGVTAVAVALQSGGLGSGLRGLQLGESDVYNTTDKSAKALAEALVEGRQHVQSLKELVIVAHASYKADALVEAAVANCPQLKELRLSHCSNSPRGMASLERAAAQRKGLRLVFEGFVYKEDYDGDDYSFDSDYD